MHCPACHTENADAASRCRSCGGPLPRKPRRRRRLAQETDTPFAPRTEACNRAALRAYYVGLLGLIPGVGLFLGPAAVVLGLRAGKRGRDEPGFTAASPARAAVLLGGVIALTNWVGLVLMLVGLSV
jgi:hypothetical protein